MGSFNRDRGNDRGASRSSGGFRDRGNDRGGSRSGGGFNRRDTERPTLYKAVCDDCGKSCEIPFRPSGDKPVYCRDCFDMRGGKEGRERDRGNDRDSDREMFSVTCDECGKKCEVPFKPSSNKPVYCSECFGKKEDSRDSRDSGRDNRDSRRSGPSMDAPRTAPVSKELTDQLVAMNSKLDRLLRALELRGKIETEEQKPAKAPKAEAVKEVAAVEKAAPAKAAKAVKVAKATKEVKAKKVTKKAAKTE